MNILISGASGLIGKALSNYLRFQGHWVYKLKRNASGSQFTWQPEKGEVTLDPSVEIDAVINLNGVNIGDKRWSKQRKHDIVDSRIQATNLLATTLASMPTPPKVLINASAIGFYGDTGYQEVDESSPAGNNFLTDIVRPWEAAAQPAVDANIRTVFIRSGVVLAKKGGALHKMLVPFKLGLGGKIGTGQQFMSWISLDDEIRAIEFILNHNDISGPVNLTSPNPVNNAEFSQTLAKQLNRPLLLPMPESLVKIMFAEMGELLLLGSARVLPTVLLNHGFQFHHPQLPQALEDTLR